MLERPSWIVCEPHLSHIQYRWDDTRASADFAYAARWVPDLMRQASLRARMALIAALHEQVVWRMQGVADVTTSRHLSAAAWLAVLDPRYLPQFELDRSRWIGPVLGPLWCAATWMMPALTAGDYRSADVEDALEYLARLAHHVAPDPEALVQWLSATAERLIARHPDVRSDPFVDLFNRFPGLQRGQPVARSEMAKAPPLPGTLVQAEWLELLKSEIVGRNPFLPDPGRLQEMKLDPVALASSPIFE